MAEGSRAAIEESEELSRLAHDLRSPLTAIRGAAALLLQAHDQLPGDKLAELLHVIDAQAARMADKVEDVIAGHRLLAGTLRLTPERLEVAEIVADGLDAMRDRHRDRRFRAGGLVEGLYVLADAERTPQLLRVLLDAAARQSPAERGVEVRAAREGAAVRVEVRHRAATALELDPLASGLARAMGGDAGLESRAGGGSFWFTLPASK
jgi:two-component system, OmpR family, sensor histidine kinase KdpD